METPIQDAGASPVDQEILSTTEPQEPDYEALAKEKGWKPKDDYQGNPEHYIDAKEFIVREPLIKHIGEQRRKIRELETTIQGIAKHYNSNIEAAKRKAIIELQKERDTAISDGNVERVREVEREMQTVATITTPETPAISLPMELEDFVKKHSDWWQKDINMTDEAIAINEAYLRRNPGKLPESLEYTEQQLKKLYPEKFSKAPQQTRNNPVEGDTPPQTGKYNVKNLTKEQKLVYDQFVRRSKIMTHDEYFKSLEEAGFAEG